MHLAIFSWEGYLLFADTPVSAPLPSSINLSKKQAHSGLLVTTTEVYNNKPSSGSITFKEARC